MQTSLCAKNGDICYTVVLATLEYKSLSNVYVDVTETYICDVVNVTILIHVYVKEIN
jgi:hypothetical protein